MIIIKPKTPAMLFSKQLARIADAERIIRDLERENALHINRKRAFIRQSYIAHIVAAWQAFHRKLATEAHQSIFLARLPEGIHPTVKKVLISELRRFNTPDAGNIDRLFLSTIAIEKVSASWYWVGITNQSAKDQLDELLDIRHSIAHTGHSNLVLSSHSNLNYMRFLYKLACITQNIVAQHAERHTGTQLYDKVQVDDSA